MGGGRKRAGNDRQSGGLSRIFRELFSYLESSGFDLENLPTGEEAIERLARGPVHPSLLATIASRYGCEFSPLFEEAACYPAPDRPCAKEALGAGLSSRYPGGLQGAFESIFEALGEKRSGQLAIANEIDRVLRQGGVAIIEAGTGIGKSIAYLVPAALFSLETGKRVVVSTHTKNLQDQLFRRDMPLLCKVLKLPISVERLLGRENYLCTRRILSRAASLAESNPGADLALLTYLDLLGENIPAGNATLPFEISLNELVAPRRCQPGACSVSERCPLARSRKKARSADIVFVNHALLLTDFAQGGGVIGPYEHAIFDEAHNLERCVIENLSVKLNAETPHRLLEPLKEALKKEEAWSLAARFISLTPIASASDLRRRVMQVAAELGKAFEELFHRIEEGMNPLGELRSTKTRYRDGGETFALYRQQIGDIYNHINNLNSLLEPICEVSLHSDLSSFAEEIEGVSDELLSVAEDLRYLCGGCDENSVFWMEWGAEGSLREICGSPISADRAFADYLESFLGSAVLTSATLSQGGDFGFLKERLGLKLFSSSTVEKIVPSPFPYDERCLVLIVSGLGDPNEDCFAQNVAGLLESIMNSISRRTMVLFTSYRLSHSVARSINRKSAKTLLVQGMGESREALSESFRRSPSAVLLGVASFWEGVDFPGDELEVLVIPKVPFPVPTEPIIEARAERLSALGEDVFQKLFLPEALLRLRQGAGRLMRRMEDRGVIMLLDERIETRSYGSAVLDALPSRRISHVDCKECIVEALNWFEGDG